MPVPLLTSLSNLVCWKFSGPWHLDNRTRKEARIRWDDIVPPYDRRGLATIRRLATTVQELHLTKITFTAPGDCARLVSSIPALRKLRCVDVDFRMPQEPEVVDASIDRLAPRLHVESLSVRIPPSTVHHEYPQTDRVSQLSSSTLRYKEWIFC